MKILMIDVGGTNVKLMASGHEGRRKVPSGPTLTAAQMAKEVIKDAAMQALASYQKGRMLFLGFGTSTGAAMIVDDVIIPLEIGMLRLSRRTHFMDALTDEARQRNGRKRWLRAAYQAIEMMQD